MRPIDPLSNTGVEPFARVYVWRALQESLQETVDLRLEFYLSDVLLLPIHAVRARDFTSAQLEEDENSPLHTR